MGDRMIGQPTTDDPYEMLADCRLQVKTLAARADLDHPKHDASALALIDIAAGDQQAWTLPQWEALLNDLDTTSMRVCDWILLQ